jgi:crotonobetainyl-CoA:carnitine CoA-transferase CaiB-like acyl-CoA transferase
MQPLTGTKIVTIAFNLPGPAAVSQLHRWGAEVVKVEPPGGDPLALHCPDFYQYLTGNQHVVRWNLKDAADRQQLDTYLATADLLVTSTLPSSLERMGLSWESLHAQFPRLCQVAIVGHAPPREEVTGHDLTYQAGVGLLAPPAMPLTLLADMAGAQTAVSHALALLAERSRTGEARHSFVAIADALEMFTLPLRFGLTMPGGPLGGAAPYYNVYPTAKGWLAVGTLEPHFWAKLCTLLAAGEGTYDEMKAIFATRTAEEWQRWGDENRLPLAVVRSSTPQS